MEKGTSSSMKLCPKFNCNLEGNKHLLNALQRVLNRQLNCTVLAESCFEVMNMCLQLRKSVTRPFSRVICKGSAVPDYYITIIYTPCSTVSLTDPLFATWYTTVTISRAPSTNLNYTRPKNI